MPNPRPENVKKDILAIALEHGIEVVGFLGLGAGDTIPADEMELLKGVRWADTHVDTSGVRDPLEIMPAARTMIILGKRLADDRQDVYYRVSGDYLASAEMMVLDSASSKIVEGLEKSGFRGADYTSYYMKVWAVLAGLGWIGRSRMFISKAHGPRLRLKGILTDADMGEPAEILGDDHCGECTECMKACPVGAIAREEVDRKKCGACPLNHCKISERSYAYCTACTFSCPVGRKSTPDPALAKQSVRGQRITP